MKPDPASDRAVHNSDNLPVRMIVGAMSLIAFMFTAGIMVLVYLGKTPDAALYTMAGGSIGSLGTLLSSTAPRAAPPTSASRASDGPMPVVMANPPEAPANVHEVKPEGGGD